jgi:hypothetical protein
VSAAVTIRMPYAFVITEPVAWSTATLVKLSLAIISGVSDWRSSSAPRMRAISGSASPTSWDRSLSSSKKLTRRTLRSAGHGQSG